MQQMLLAITTHPYWQHCGAMLISKLVGRHPIRTDSGRPSLNPSLRSHPGSSVACLATWALRATLTQSDGGAHMNRWQHGPLDRQQCVGRVVPRCHHVVWAFT
eukprot:362783-Chlamydomonas_euryale.AAC.18